MVSSQISLLHTIILHSSSYERKLVLHCWRTSAYGTHAVDCHRRSCGVRFHSSKMCVMVFVLISYLVRGLFLNLQIVPVFLLRNCSVHTQPRLQVGADAGVIADRYYCSSSSSTYRLKQHAAHEAALLGSISRRITRLRRYVKRCACLFVRRNQQKR